jgi:AcrR family transcriptional regulator
LKKSEISARRKETIFDAALACFNETGYYKTSMDAIAEKARITKHGLYYHFKSKDHLFIELFHQRGEKYFAQIDAYLGEVTDSEQKMRLFIDKGNQIIHDHLDFLRFFIEFMSIGMRNKAICNVITEHYKSSIRNFKPLLAESISQDSLTTYDAEKVARAIFVSSIGMFFSYFCLEPDFDLVEQQNFNIEKILKGIRNK